MVGVFSLELQRIYRYLLEETNQQYSILHALDGYDEISLTGDTKVVHRTVELQRLMLPLFNQNAESESNWWGQIDSRRC